MKRALLLFLSACSIVCSQRQTGGPDPHPSAAWDPLLDTIQTRTLRYFLETTSAQNGLAPDRWPARSPSSIAAVGFALTCYPIAVEHGLITRPDGAARVLTTLRFFRRLAPSDATASPGGYKGFYYHFIRMEDGAREWESELSTIDTGLLMMGVLCCQSYFSADNPQERELRSLADSLYRRIDWKWAMAGRPGITMGWTPEHGFHDLTWNGYNEAMFLYIIALGSPTHPVPAEAWEHWTSSYAWGPMYGYEYVQFAPLFGHQFTQCWLDLRGVPDTYMRAHGIDYFENSRRATLAQRAYASANEKGWIGYSDSLWGFTACDGPKDTAFDVEGTRRRFESYGARGFSPRWSNDDGTIAPTAAGGSLPFAPEVCIPALRTMRRSFDTLLWSRYGFKDAFNLTYRTPATPAGWFDRDYLGIDQGPIAVMIENFRNGFVWNIMKKNSVIVEGLRRAGFSGGWLDSPR